MATACTLALCLLLASSTALALRLSPEDGRSFCNVELTSGTVGCSKPVQVTGQFGISGLTGWDLTSHEDFFNSTDYKYNMHCNWLIRRPNDKRLVLVRIVKMNLQPNFFTTEQDTLRLEYVGYNSSKASNIAIHGTHLNKLFLAQSDFKITFKTDAEFNYRGFYIQTAFVDLDMAVEIQAQSSSDDWQCNQAEELQQLTMSGFTAPGGRLVSQETPFLCNASCQWTIESPSSDDFILFWIDKIMFNYKFLTWELWCINDNVTISFTNALTGQVENASFCEPSQNDKLFLANSSLEVRLSTDSRIDGMKEFSLKWMYLNESQALDAIQLLDILENNSSRQPQCQAMQQVTGQRLGSVGIFPGGSLVSHAGFLTDNTSTYEPNMNCSWTISPPDNATLVHLVVDQVNLATLSYTTSSCHRDQLFFTFTNAFTNRREIRYMEQCRPTHYSQPINFTSSGDIIINFVTDHEFQDRGFQLSWHFMSFEDVQQLPEVKRFPHRPCPRPGPDAGGLQMARYDPNRFCIWKWTVKYGEMMVFNIESLDLDSRDYFRRDYKAHEAYRCSNGYDVLSFQFFDIYGNKVTQHYCGTHNEREADRMFLNAHNGSVSLTAYNGSVEVTFSSDFIIGGDGFYFAFERKTEYNGKFRCAAMKAMDSRRRSIAERLPKGAERNCRWTVTPRPTSAAFRLRVVKFHMVIPYRLVSSKPIEDCQQFLSIKSKYGMNKATNSYGIVNMTICLQHPVNSTADLFSLVSTGPVEIQLRTAYFPRPIDYELVIEDMSTDELELDG